MASVCPPFAESLDIVIQDYKPGLVLRPKQHEVLQYVYDKEGDAIISLPTGYGKSLIFHLIGRLLRAKHGQNREDGKGVTLVVAPLNLIQHDQLLSLQKRGVSACKLNVACHGEYLVGDEADQETEAGQKVSVLSCRGYPSVVGFRVT